MAWRLIMRDLSGHQEFRLSQKTLPRPLVTTPFVLAVRSEFSELSGATLLLAHAASPEQISRIGNQVESAPEIKKLDQLSFPTYS
jgi:hypothetical protein